MDEAMKKSEEALWKNKAYQEMREAGSSDHEARFAIGTKHARIESDAAALFGAVKAFIASGAGGITRDKREWNQSGKAVTRLFGVYLDFLAKKAGGYSYKERGKMTGIFFQRCYISEQERFVSERSCRHQACCAGACENDWHFESRFSNEANVLRIPNVLSVSAKWERFVFWNGF